MPQKKQNHLQLKQKNLTELFNSCLNKYLKWKSAVCENVSHQCWYHQFVNKVRPNVYSGLNRAFGYDLLDKFYCTTLYFYNNPNVTL